MEPGQDGLRLQEAIRTAWVSFPGSRVHAPCFFFLCGLSEFSLNQILKTASRCTRANGPRNRLLLQKILQDPDAPDPDKD